MNGPVRFAAGYARVCALKTQLWSPIDRGLVVRAGVAPDGRPVRGDPVEVFPSLVRWYVTVSKMYPAARPVLTWLFRRHEIENVKLLWRAALRNRAPIAACWRPLEPLGTVAFEPRAIVPDELVQRLAPTPYGEIARALRRSHAADLPAAEMGLDRWVWIGLRDEMRRLPGRERAAARLVRLLILEHDLDLLRRGTAFELDADLVAKATVCLSQEHRAPELAQVATWTPAAGALATVLPARLARQLGNPANWDDAVLSVRRSRLRACRSAFVGWPFELAPAIAALLLREAQAQAAMSVAAARSAGGGAEAFLPLALASAPLEM